MKIRHAILVALFALLQGLAPLLHAHMGADRSGASGVHMHSGLHVAPAAGSTERFTDIGPLDAQVVGLGQEIRRDLSWQPVDVAQAALPASGECTHAVHEPPPTSVVPAHVRSAHRLLPPSHAPPPAIA